MADHSLTGRIQRLKQQMEYADGKAAQWKAKAEVARNKLDRLEAEVRQIQLDAGGAG